MSYDKRSTPASVSCGIQTVFCHQKQCHRAVYDFLYILDSFYKRIFLTDQGSDQFSCVDLSAAHLLEMCMSMGIHFV